VRVSFGEVGSDPGQFSYPRCLDHDQSALWVIDKMARVQRLDPVTGQCLGGWRMPEWENGKPTGITVWAPPAGGKTRVFIPDTHYHRVMIYDPRGAAAPDRALESRGTLLASFGQYGEGDGQFIYLTDVAVLPTPDGRGIGRLYVSEYGGHDRISVFEPAPGQPPNEETAFVFKFSFGKFGDGASPESVEFNRPQSIEIDAGAKELVVTDACNHRIGRFTYEGTLVKWIGGREQAGKAPGQMSYPYGLALLGDGTAIVAEFGNNRVQRFDLATGQGLGVYGEPGRLRGQLASPWAVCAFGREVFVLDSGNNRVQSFARPSAHRRAADASSPGGGHG
jgi:DNA-binding beta-propeller fold protein YncE